MSLHSDRPNNNSRAALMTPAISRHAIAARIAAAVLLSIGSLAFAQSTGVPRLQGQVPLADQLSGRALLGYQKNVKVIGHNTVAGRMQNGNLGWVDDCAYIGAFAPGDDATFGTAVIDVSHPRNPTLVKILPHFPAPF